MAETTVQDLDQSLSGFAALLSTASITKGDEIPPCNSLELSSFLSPSADESSCCSLPSLSLHKEASNSSPNCNMSLEEVAALNLAKPVTHGRINIARAPSVVAKNISSSFLTLVESRLRSSIIALFKQAANPRRNQYPQSEIMINLLSNPNIFSMFNVVTSFRVLPVGNKDDKGGIVLPLIFEVTIDMSIFSSPISVSLRSPGTIAGSLSEAGDGLKSVEVILDTLSLLRAMMKQARYVIRKEIALATAVSSILSTDQKHAASQPTFLKGNSSVSNNATSIGSMPPPPPRRKSQQSIRTAIEASATAEPAGISSKQAPSSTIKNNASFSMPAGSNTSENERDDFSRVRGASFLAEENSDSSRWKSKLKRMTENTIDRSLHNLQNKKRRILSCPDFKSGGSSSFKRSTFYFKKS